MNTQGGKDDSFFRWYYYFVFRIFAYGKIVNKVFGIDTSRKMPSKEHYDGVDYVPLSTSNNAFIQLLNIAGTGPVFGPIMGALFGPVAFIIIPHHSSWRYFSWANQTTGTIALFIESGYLIIKKKNFWISLILAVFMLMVTMSYLGNAKIGFNLPWKYAYIFAFVITCVMVVIFLIRNVKAKNNNIPTDDVL